MAYDEHGPWEPNNRGRVVSLAWTRKSVAALDALAPVQQLVLGVAGYGYHWHGSVAPAQLSDAQARARVRQAHTTASWNASVGEWTATLPDGEVLGCPLAPSDRDAGQALPPRRRRDLGARPAGPDPSDPIAAAGGARLNGIFRLVAHIIIVSGTGRYADPWHPFVQTTSAVSRHLSELGRVTVSEDVDAVLAGFSAETARPDLLVVNIGNPPVDSPTPDAADGLTAYLRSGGALLALHSSATTFVGWDQWEGVLGGKWIRGTSYHPPQQTARVSVVPGPVTEGLDSGFEVDDEFYKSLRVARGVVVLATHRVEGIAEPIAWAHEVFGARVIYDALGHDPASYRSRGRVSLLLAEARWLLAGTGDRPESTP